MLNVGIECLSSELNASDWFNIYKLGTTKKDRFIMFWFMVNAILVMAFLLKVFGNKKTFPIYLRHPWLLNWIPGKNVKITLNGMFFSIPLVLEEISLFHSGYEKNELEFINNLQLKKDCVILDIGANMGIYTITATKQFPNSKIISIEASPYFFKHLQYNCTLNKVSNVLLINKAAFDKNDKVVEFYEGFFSTLEEKFLFDLGFPENKIKKEKVKTITIDSLIENEKLEQINLLKMDIEGTEVSALKGALRSLKQKKIKNMIIEYHTVENKNSIIKLLKKYDYKPEFVPRTDYIKYTGLDNPDIENGHIMASAEDKNLLRVFEPFDNNSKN